MADLEEMIALPAGRWRWHTSNSWKRLKAEGRLGETTSVIVPYVCEDRCPDLIISREVMAVTESLPQLLMFVQEMAIGAYTHEEAGVRAHAILTQIMESRRKL